MDWITEHWLISMVVIVCVVCVTDIGILRGLRNIKGKGEEPTVEDTIFLKYYFNFPWRKKQKVTQQAASRVMSPDERATRAFFAGVIFGASFIGLFTFMVLVFCAPKCF